MTLSVGIGSFGTIGRQVAKVLDDGGLPGLSLGLVSARDKDQAAERMAGFRKPVAVVDLGELAQCDVVLEAAPVPTGALLGLDAVRAAAEGEIFSVKMVTRKPPGGLKGAPHLEQNQISVDGLTEAKLVFRGTAREGAIGFPANVNVAAALSLAGIGPDRTTLEIWADPGVDRNTHHIEVESDSARFALDIATIPTEENPKTGKITALSVIACLRSLTQTLRVGT